MFESVFRAVADFSSVTKEARSAGDAMDNMADTVERAGKRSSQATDEMGSKAKGVGAAFAGAFSAVAVMEFAGRVVRFAGDAVSSYSRLEDATAAAGVVFGSSMSKIQEQAQGAASSLGMSQSQVIDAANSFGTYGKSAGLAGNDLATFASSLIQTAGDMASFRGTTPEQAIEAVGAALRGETEPIRAYGVLMDDASLRQQALKMGLIKTTKEALTPQQKVLAAQALIMKQTSDAQGDFARTSDSTANVQKTLAAETDNVTAKIGGQLAPAFTAARVAILAALNGVSGIIETLQNSGMLVPILAGLGAILLAVLAPAIWANVVAALAWAAALLANPITWVVLGIGLLVAAIVWLVGNWDTAVAWITSVWGGFVGWLSATWAGIVAAVTGFGNSIVKFLQGAWDSIVGAAQAAWNGILAFLGMVMKLLPYIIIGPIGLLVLWIIANWDRIVAGTRAAWDNVVAFLASIPGRIMAGLQFLSTLPAILGAWFLGVLNAARDKFGQVVAFIGTIPGRIVSGLSDLASLAARAAAWFVGFVNSAKDKFGDAVSFASTIPDKFLRALGNLGGLLVSAGRSIVDGFLRGIKSAWDGLVGWVQGAMANLRGLWPFSPAKWGPFSGHGYVTYSGEALGQDFARSLVDQAGTVERGARRMLSAARNVFSSVGQFDIGGALALTPSAQPGMALAPTSGYSPQTSTTNSSTATNLYIDGMKVGMDSRLEGAVRELVGVIGDNRRLDRYDDNGIGD